MLSSVSLGWASERSILLMTTMGLRPSFSALDRTNLVCGMTDSAASTSSTTPSTIDRMRSTSPPKSAWPGVSTILICVPCHSTLVHLARMVMPRSRSRSLESSARSSMCWFSRTEPDCLRSWSTSVVLPWSTWAMMAMLRMSIKTGALWGGGLIDGRQNRGNRALAANPGPIATAGKVVFFVAIAGESCNSLQNNNSERNKFKNPW